MNRIARKIEVLGQYIDPVRAKLTNLGNSGPHFSVSRCSLPPFFLPNDYQMNGSFPFSAGDSRNTDPLLFRVKRSSPAGTTAAQTRFHRERARCRFGPLYKPHYICGEQSQSKFSRFGLLRNRVTKNETPGRRAGSIFDSIQKLTPLFFDFLDPISIFAFPTKPTSPEFF